MRKRRFELLVLIETESGEMVETTFNAKEYRRKSHKETVESFLTMIEDNCQSVAACIIDNEENSIPALTASTNEAAQLLRQKAMERLARN